MKWSRRFEANKNSQNSNNGFWYAWSVPFINRNDFFSLEYLPNKEKEVPLNNLFLEMKMN